MKAFFLVAFFVFGCVSSHAQMNLVRNPSLEDHWRIPATYDEIAFANYWSCIDTLHTYPALGDTFGDPNCTPEYINAAATNFCCGVPAGGYYYHNCRTGNGMAEVKMYYNGYDSSAAPYQRDYLQGRLYAPLTVGMSYCVTFYVVMEGASVNAINSIGAYLDDGSIDTNNHCGLPHMEDVPQVMETAIINDTLNWIKIQGSFIANGTEKYITIGNFRDTAHTSKIQVLIVPPGGEESYYLVDDISVIKSSEVATAGPDVTIASGDTAWVGIDSNGDGMPCYWYVLGGTSPIDSGGRIGVHPSGTTTYVVSLDLCGTVTYDTVTVTVVPLGVGNLKTREFENLKMYPNPTTGMLNIVHAQGAQMVLYDVLGRAMKLSVMNGAGGVTIGSDNEQLQLGDLQKGVYFADFVDPVTGYRVTRKIMKE